MAEFRWSTRIAGKPCIVCCRMDGNYYTLYVDDERIGSFQRKMGQDRDGGIDEPITIRGEECRFVVWSEQPDVVVRGRLLGEKTEYLLEKQARERSFFMTGLVMMVIGAVIAVIYWILTCVSPGKDYSGMLLGTVLLLAYGVYLLYKWKPTKEKKNDVQ